MDYLVILLVFVGLTYITTSYTAYREIREKNLKVAFNWYNVFFF